MLLAFPQPCLPATEAHYPLAAMEAHASHWLLCFNPYVLVWLLCYSLSASDAESLGGSVGLLRLRGKSVFSSTVNCREGVTKPATWPSQAQPS